MTSPPVISVTLQELSQSPHPSSSSSPYSVNFTRVEMISTTGKSRNSLLRDRPRSFPWVRQVKHTGGYALVGLMWSAILVQASHAQVTSNDVSRLNPTEVREVIQVTSEQHVRETLAFAAVHHLKVSMAGKKHSQGGHTSINGGIVLDMTAFSHILHLDQDTKVITVESGVTWGQIQDYVNPYGLAVEVQQSSNIFTVGGSLAHGRDPRFGPVIETVKSLRVMNAAAEIPNVSRLENSELFSLVIGGYGLFGVVLTADIQLTEDDVYKKSCKTLDY